MRNWLRGVSLAMVCVGVSSSTVVAGGFPSGAYVGKQADWFRGADGKRVMENVLSHQSVRGDWPKNFDTGEKPYRGDPADLRGTFDNGAGRGELRFLARAYRATGETRARDAFLKGVDHIFKAQYSNGGWPQTYPLGSGYSRHITFNDGTMIGLMELLRDVAESKEFDFVDSKRRARASRAFDAGVECILKCQILVDGRPTAWCAQHDEITFEPRKARTYEHVSLSGGESAGIILLLMSLENPKPEVVLAVNGACRWYEQVQLHGIRQTQRAGDKIIVPDADAPPLWARFYQIGTNRPIFSGRDGVIKYDITQIEHERRNGYSWYGYSGREVLRQWPKWKQEQLTLRSK